MGWKFVLRWTIGVLLSGSWAMRPRVLASRNQPPIDGLIPRIASMPDDELRSVYADYEFLAAVDQNAEVKQIRDACLREIDRRNKP